MKMHFLSSLKIVAVVLRDSDFQLGKNACINKSWLVHY